VIVASPTGDRRSADNFTTLGKFNGRDILMLDCAESRFSSVEIFEEHRVAFMKNFTPCSWLKETSRHDEPMEKLADKMT